jgi:3'-phosphoadenosine 5'-phosphosulfate sulfotransferase (PAPS reductase)/FAD synthetase
MSLEQRTLYIVLVLSNGLKLVREINNRKKETKIGFKPIFEKERQFFKEKTGIDLPTECWRNGSKIYLDFTQTTPLLQFKVENKEIKITKNNFNKLDINQQKKISELISLNLNRIQTLENNSIERIVRYIKDNPDQYYAVAHSGGKDSTVILYLWLKALEKLDTKPKWESYFCNTSNDTAETYKLIKTLKRILNDTYDINLRIVNPKIGFYPWIIKIKNYLVPTALMRNCCSTYKEGQINKVYDKNLNLTMVLGVRKYESAKRANFDYIMDHKWQLEQYGSDNMPENWTRFAPAVEWKDEDIWLHILYNQLVYNNQYNYGFNRCGCLICPYQSDYIDLLIERYYPSLWSRWIDILTKSYEIQHILINLKWTLQEYINGKWKTGISKEYELINKSPTKERIKELADIKGISENMAAKYFNKRCKCGKKMNPTELAMFYKTYGRYEDCSHDNRELLCKKCYCELNKITSKEYSKKSVEYREGGCKLF